MKSLVSETLRHGTDKAMRSKSIATVHGIPERVVRVSIRELIADGLPIASSTDSKTGGYFIAETKQEAEDYIGKLRHRIIEDCLRLRDFKRATKEMRNPDQPYLF